MNKKIKETILIVLNNAGTKCGKDIDRFDKKGFDKMYDKSKERQNDLKCAYDYILNLEVEK